MHNATLGHHAWVFLLAMCKSSRKAECCPSCQSDLLTFLDASLLMLCHPQFLGFQIGVFHVECKATTRGPRLIEVNCRMGGGFVR